jgi:hypothetical protein
MIRFHEYHAHARRKNGTQYRFIYAKRQGWQKLGAQLKVVFVEHLSSEELAAFLADSLTDAERKEAERHLVSCAECRSELIEGQRAISSLPSKRLDRRWFAVAGVAAAAAIVIIFLPRTELIRNPAGVEREVQSATTDAGAVSIVSPSADGELAALPGTFVWRKNDDASYKITVTDASGRPVWSAATSDTSIALPDTVRLARATQFFWYVDALRSDGRSVTSGVNNFHTPR